MTKDLIAQEKVDFIRIDTIQISPKNNKMIFLFGSDNISFYSESCGTKFSSFEHEKGLTQFRISKQNDSFLLGHLPHDCVEFNPECNPDEKKLYVSEDRGATWKFVLDNVIQAQWDKLVHFAFGSEKRIFAVHRLVRENGPSTLFL